MNLKDYSDHNQNIGRVQATTKDGVPRYYSQQETRLKSAKEQNIEKTFM